MLCDVADDGLAAIADRYVLHGDGGLALAPVAVQRLDLGRKRARKPAQCARGAVVLGEVVRIRKVMGGSHRHHVNGNICATSMASTESRGRMLFTIEIMKERSTSSGLSPLT